jgi:large subunit ribosomal protein L29
MKANKFREVDAAELAGQAAETQEQLFRLRFQIGMGQAEGLKRYRELRKDRARMLTVERERELDPAKAQAAAEAAQAAAKKKGGKKKGK